MPSESLTQLLIDWNRGSDDALQQILPRVYDELRRLAAGYMKRERSDHTLRPTALVHEAFVRLIDQRRVTWQNRAHFIGVAARMMRRTLVDHARKRKRIKRVEGGQRVTLDEGLRSSEREEIDVLSLDLAMKRLSEMDERQGRVVELRVFGGLTIEETAEVLGVSTPTVKRDWASAKAWLYTQLGG